MHTVPLRLHPGNDLRGALEATTRDQGLPAAFVLAGIGSLAGAQLRLAGAAQATALAGDLEILTLAGSLGPDGAHLHMTVADASGRVSGGHVAPGCRVRTTAEVLIAVLPAWRFGRAPDPDTGHAELTIAPTPRA
jgi:predicted DNA-binding protein with PD1-like motif